MPRKTAKKEEVQEVKVVEVAKAAVVEKESKKDNDKKTDKKVDKKTKKWAEVVEEHETVEEKESESESEVEDIDDDEDDEDFVEQLISIVPTKVVGPNVEEKDKKSIVDFDYDEIAQMDDEELADYDTIELLKVVMVRGFTSKNPILWNRTKSLLKELNFEKPDFPVHNNYHNNHHHNNNYHRGGFRTGFHESVKGTKFNRDDNENSNGFVKVSDKDEGFNHNEKFDKYNKNKHFNKYDKKEKDTTNDKVENEPEGNEKKTFNAHGGGGGYRGRGGFRGGFRGGRGGF